ncbi:hypothetical protein ACFQZ4_44435 [Catellatospora coxensis]|uniref:Uncharacterized protein n=1 Tax=Catellatospora coxensis TaxID=310354 RepID=A0A8J3KK71_9ACTN|nr:hypothetical protein [Catellatospora coxensis]GIG04133.1 hypothetical protein Cco03nite_08330 [Catellatospora coxensis]
MTESAEHQFLSETFLEVLGRLSASRLYAFREAERKKFDFSCHLKENWDYSLDGQTLWKHTEGVDKDVRTLLVASDAQIRAYVARHTTKNRNTFYEATRDFRSSGHSQVLNRLKVFWVPADFDADDETARALVGRELAAEVTNDLLFNIVFGRLSAGAVRSVLISSGMAALETALLHHIATSGFCNYSELRRRFEVSPATLRDRMARLHLSRFLIQPRNGHQMYHVSPAGRAYLRLCEQLFRHVMGAELPQETCDLLRLLDIEPDLEFRKHPRYSDDWLGGRTPTAMFQMFASRAVVATVSWGVDWDQMTLRADPGELDSSRWLEI